MACRGQQTRCETEVLEIIMEEGEGEEQLHARLVVGGGMTGGTVVLGVGRQRVGMRQRQPHEEQHGMMGTTALGNR